MAASLCLPACGAEVDPQPSTSTADTRADALTSVGIERVIPVRFVYLRGAGAAEEPPPANLLERLSQSVAGANHAFRGAGLAFSISSVRSVLAPHFREGRNGAGSPYLTAVTRGVGAGSVHDQLGRIFQAGCFSDTDATYARTPEKWLQRAVFHHSCAPADVLYVFMPESMPAGSECAQSIRNVMLKVTPDVGNDRHHGDLGILAHELGHLFGLGHFDNHGDWHPRNNAQITPADLWDLYYCPGSSGAQAHRYFTSAPDSALGCAAYSRYGKVYDDYLSNCAPLHPAAPASCTLAGSPAAYVETPSATDSRLAGSVTFPIPSPSGTIMGINAMSYRGIFLPTTNSAMPRMFSESQLEIIRYGLRYDRLLTNIDPFNREGDEYTAPYNGKPRLGRTTLRQPLAKLDINGDGTRDLVVWSAGSNGTLGATSGTFFIALGPTFQTSYTRSFGAVGDVPVVQYFNDDQRADLGVYRPGGSGAGAPSDASVFYWCPSTGDVPPDCAVNGGTVSKAFGERSDVPLAGLAFGYPSIAVYRPSTGVVYWGNPALIPGVYNGAVLAAGAAADALPFSGDFDGDGITDWASYNQNAQLEALLSTSGWGVRRIRRLPGPYALELYDTQTGLSDRGTGLPLVGMKALIAGQWRDVLTSYHPGFAEAKINFDSTSDVPFPHAAVTRDVTISEDAAIPLGGLQSGSDATVAWFRPGSPGTAAAPGVPAVPARPARLLRRKMTAAGAVTSLPDRTFAAFPTGATVGVVSDMSGDGVPDVIVADFPRAQVHILRSNEDFTVVTTVAVPAAFSHLL